MTEFTDEDYEKIMKISKRRCLENAFEMAEVAKQPELTASTDLRTEYLTAANFWLLLAILKELEDGRK